MDDFVLPPDKTYSDYYNEAYSVAFKTHLTTGTEEGKKQGHRIGSEIGKIQGFCDFLTHQNTIEKNPKQKVIQLSNKITALIEKFPFDEPTNESFQTNIDQIRAYFRQIAALSRGKDIHMKMNGFLESCKNGLNMRPDSFNI